MVREQALLDGAKPAIFCRSGKRTFAALYSAAARIASGLRAQGVRHGSRVGILLPNCAEWLEACLGITMASGVAVPFSTWSTEQELKFLFKDSGIAALIAATTFADRNFAGDIGRILDRDPSLALRRDAVFMVGEEPGSFRSFDELLKFAPLEALPPGERPGAQDDALVLYTSGSSSAPKGVRLAHAGLVENGFNIGERQGLDASDRIFLSVPLFWAYGSANAMPAAFTHGGALVLMDRFAEAPALKAAARLAYGMAGIGEPRSQFDVVEISDATAYQQLIAYDNLGLSEPSRWQANVETGFFAPDGKVPVNLSGGISSLNPVFCTGLMRICEAARQVRGKAGAIQKAGVDRALAHAASGFAMMYQTVVVLKKGASASARPGWV